MQSDWKIRVARQLSWPPFLPFIAIAERKTGENTKLVINAEGNTSEEALRNLYNKMEGKSSCKSFCPIPI
jgi:hypothetical protein